MLNKRGKIGVNPKISVITVVRNGENIIAKTMNSVVNQTYTDMEYLVWDGFSTDGTLDEVQRNASKETRIISLSDSGPYDAMNRAAHEVCGDWLIFMNSGDAFADKNALTDLAKELTDNVDIVYGGCIKVFPFGERIQLPGLTKDLKYSSIFWHQSVMVRRELHVQYPFDTSLRVAADYDFFWRMYRTGKRFYRVERVVSRVSIGGISDVNELQGINERYLSVKNDIPWLGTKNYVNCIISYYCRSFLKSVLPIKFVEWIRLHRKVSA